MKVLGRLEPSGSAPPNLPESLKARIPSEAVRVPNLREILVSRFDVRRGSTGLDAENTAAFRVELEADWPSFHRWVVLSFGAVHRCGARVRANLPLYFTPTTSQTE